MSSAGECRSTPRIFRLLAPLSLVNLGSFQLTVRRGSDVREFYIGIENGIVSNVGRMPTGWIHGRHITGAFPFPKRPNDLSGSLSVGLDSSGNDIFLDSPSDSLWSGVELREFNGGSCPISCSGLSFKSEDVDAGVAGGPISPSKGSGVRAMRGRESIFVNGCSIRGVLFVEDDGVPPVTESVAFRGIGKRIGRLTAR